MMIYSRSEQVCEEKYGQECPVWIWNILVNNYKNNHKEYLEPESNNDNNKWMEFWFISLFVTKKINRKKSQSFVFIVSSAFYVDNVFKKMF